jgi:hypothetical protein
MVKVSRLAECLLLVTSDSSGIAQQFSERLGYAAITVSVGMNGV